MDCPLLILVILDLILTVQSTSIAVQPSPVATVAEGSVLWLTCTYDLDGGTLGQLVWKGNDSGTVATVTPTATPPCSTLYPDAYTPDCSQLSSNEVRLGILTPVHGHTYSCLVQLSNYTLIGPKSTQVDVVVPVPSVTFTPPISDTVTVTPGGSQTYTCVSGNCRPQARIEWYKDGMNVTTHTGSVSSDGDKFVTTSSYTLTGAKGDSPATVQCRASNVDGMTPVQSGVKNFVVQWPPDGPPVISGYTNSSILYVNDTLSLSCRQTGGNPLSTLTWTGVCRGIPDTDGSTGTESVSTIIITVTKGYNQGTCGCVSTHPQPQGQDRSEVIFTVHYNKDELEEHLQSIMRPASDVAATVSNSSSSTIRSGPVSVPPASHPQESEDEMLSASLRTPVAVTEQANQMTSPKPTGDSQMIDLYPGSGVKIGSSQLNMCRRKAKDSPTAMARLLLLVFFDQKTLAESCAKGTSKRKALDSKILDAIVYSPTKDPVLTGYTEGQILYEGSPDLSLTCTQEGGNPLSTITWDCEGQTGTPGTGSSTEVTSTVQVPSDRSINRKSCTCTSRSPDTNIIFEKSKTVVFTIYYAPLSAQLPSITGYTSGEVLYEGDPTRSIQCHQAGGFPLATLTWDCFGLSGINMSTQSASVSTIQLPTNRDYNGRNCTCTASHPDSNVIYRRSDYVTVNVHYPPSTPTISGTPTHPWLEGESGTLNCNYVEGFPALTRVEWFRNGRPQIGQLTPSITLTSLTKDENQVGYTCRVKNDFTDVKLTNLTSPVMNLNVEFRPLVTLTPTTLTVVEGQTAQVTCDTEGNPTPRVEWLRGGSSVQTGQGTSLTLTLGDVDRSETDNYTCRAEGVSSVQGRQLITQMMTLIGVQYPPDVTVVAPSGVEEGDTNVQLMCQTLGEPNTLTSQSWTQTIDQTFITDQFTYKTSLHDTIVLAEVSMDDVGMYTCSVSNGVPDRNGQTLQSNSAILDVKVAAKFNNSDENKLFYGELQKPLVVKIPFYSNPPVIYVADIEWTQMTTGQNIIPSGDITFNLHDREGIYLPIKGAKLLLSGQAAVMTIRSFESSFVGDYNVTIYNDGRHRHSTYRFSLTTLSDYPKDPTGFRIMDYTSTTITVEWNKGFNGGHAQTFVIMYGPFGGTSVQTISVLEQQQLTYTKEITGLQPNTRYQLNLYSYNKVGNSSLSSGIGIIGKTQLHSAAVTSNLNTVAIVFFILASLMLLITASLFICIFCRQKLKGITAYKRKHIDKPGGHGHQSDGSTYDDLNLEEREPPSTYESIGREPAECEEDTADNRRQYESLGTRNDASVYDKLKGPTNNTYENTITRR